MGYNGVKESFQKFAVNQALKYLEKNPEENLPKLMAMVDKVTPKDWYVSQRNAVRKTLEEKGNWYDFILRLWDLDPEVRKTVFKNLILNASLTGSARQDELTAKYNCNIPWAILLDPTSACNLHCTGCWAAEYGHSLNLSLETIDSIIRQGKEMGTYMYIYTGGEPLVRKKDLIKICEMHPDCEFLSFQRHADRRGILSGDAARQELRAGDQPRGLRGRERQPPRAGHLRQGAARHGTA